MQVIDLCDSEEDEPPPSRPAPPLFIPSHSKLYSLFPNHSGEAKAASRKEAKAQKRREREAKELEKKQE